MAEQKDTPDCDLLVIGGGINGTAIAREASGHGLKVVLCEQDDLASATASASTKLIHAGQRHLRHRAFGALRDALREREIMLRTAPHVVSPLRMAALTPPEVGSDWRIRLGLVLCDRLAGRSVLPRSKTIDLREHPAGAPLRDDFGRCLVYSDCWVEEARLAVLNARAAAERGAEIRTRLRLTQARRQTEHWDATLCDMHSGSEHSITCRVLVNAAGQWCGEVLRMAGLTPSGELRFLRGVHIVVPRLYQGDHAYALHLDGAHVVFALPYEHAYTLIGAGERDVSDASDGGAPDEAEIADLCKAAGRMFRQTLTPNDAVWSYGGVRALWDGGVTGALDIAGDDALDLDTGGDRPPILSIYGGRIAGARRLAESAMARLQPYVAVTRPHWTRSEPLPGGDIADADFEGFLAEVCQRYHWLPRELARRYAHAYGTRLTRVLGDAGSDGELGVRLGNGLYEAELRYLVQEEWAQTAEDVLWRRTKLGLHAEPETVARLRSWLQAQGLGAAVT